MSRLKKIAEITDHKDIELTVDTLFKKELEAQAKNIGYPYNDGVFSLMKNHPTYQDIIFNQIPELHTKLVELATEWAEETKNNYPEELTEK